MRALSGNTTTRRRPLPLPVYWRPDAGLLDDRSVTRFLDRQPPPAARSESDDDLPTSHDDCDDDDGGGADDDVVFDHSIARPAAAAAPRRTRLDDSPPRHSPRVLRQRRCRQRRRRDEDEIDEEDEGWSEWATIRPPKKKIADEIKPRTQVSKQLRLGSNLALQSLSEVTPIIEQPHRRRDSIAERNENQDSLLLALRSFWKKKEEGDDLEPGAALLVPRSELVDAVATSVYSSSSSLTLNKKRVYAHYAHSPHPHTHTTHTHIHTHTTEHIDYGLI
jgi:hypothetical protein